MTNTSQKFMVGQTVFCSLPDPLLRNKPFNVVSCEVISEVRVYTVKDSYDRKFTVSEGYLHDYLKDCMNVFYSGDDIMILGSETALSGTWLGKTEDDRAIYATNGNVRVRVANLTVVPYDQNVEDLAVQMSNILRKVDLTDSNTSMLKARLVAYEMVQEGLV